MKQKNTLQWLSIVAGKAKLLVGVLVAVQAVLSVSSIAFAFVLRRIINMAVDGVQGGSVLRVPVGICAVGRRDRSTDRIGCCKSFSERVHHNHRRKPL